MNDLLEAYKETMSYWPSGVAVATSDFETASYGMTVSSFTSVSLHPPMVSMCIDKRTQMCALLQKSKHFKIYILSHSQSNLAQVFADHKLTMAERFAKANFSTCLGFLDCSLHSFHDTGDHLIYVGDVKHAQVSNSTGEPLVFYRRSFKKLLDES